MPYIPCRIRHVKWHQAVRFPANSHCSISWNAGLLKWNGEHLILLERASSDVIDFARPYLFGPARLEVVLHDGRSALDFSVERVGGFKDVLACFTSAIVVWTVLMGGLALWIMHKDPDPLLPLTDKLYFSIGFGLVIGAVGAGLAVIKHLWQPLGYHCTCHGTTFVVARKHWPRFSQWIR